MLGIKKRDRKQEAYERIEGDVMLVREANGSDKRIELLIRQGFNDHPGISLSQELALLRKHEMGIEDEDEWNDYCSFVQACIDHSKEELL